MNWQILAISTPIAFVIFQAISKTLPKTISVFLVNAYAMMAGVILMICLHFLFADKKTPILGTKYLPAVLGIGLLIAIGNFGIIKAYSLGAPQSLFTILFYVALIVYGVVFGLLFWHEKLHALQVLGLVLAIAGIFMTIHFKK